MTYKTQPQSTSHILMVRPVNFGFNPQTADSNAFQDVKLAAQTKDVAQEDALKEFENMVAQLQAAGINLTVVADTPLPYTPDSVFPNNWISFHQSGKVVLYPMQAENRRLERRMDIVDQLKTQYQVEEIIDLTHFENDGKFLEGTGSMVLDRRYKIAYACLSPRTNAAVLTAFSEAMGYEIVSFKAVDANNKAVYHTNVVMCVGDNFATVCLAAINDPDQRLLVRNKLVETGKQIIEISQDQMANFAGNMLLVNNMRGEKTLVMSTRAFESLTAKQRDELDDYATLMHFDLSMIEGNGGGSARCMMAEIHLPQK
ncbi:MAG: amidinotransferase [Cytophagia bacterium]|nr:MAG: amidinotransferase [Cytophagales bacterium]TAG41230.1 MAG: amidinotransferase [Cytophagia bacterium]TAG57723.1 MAG: amidinotransferase [Runella slithyformis]TAG61706.1 MAG: amidinotransferase [Runella slithyformis]TAG82915.1 MAG: amidinotransferase [Cytophagales bacterium]